MDTILEQTTGATVKDSGDGLFSADDLASLKENRRLRKALVTALAGDGKVPADRSEKTMLISLMAGIDNEIIGRARLKVAAKTEEQMTNLTGLITQTLLHCKVEPIPNAPPRNMSLPDSIKTGPVVPGEMATGLAPVSLKELHGN